ncbi:hypothetical protein Tco_0565307 [Tanacetum coccineum]
MANLEFCDTHNMVAYLKKPEGSEGFHQIADFLNSSHKRTLDNGEMEITATIDGKVKIVFEASIRRHLELEDSDGISNLPTTEIFKQLALMGSKKTAWEQFSSNIATAIICLATNRTFNFFKMIFDGMVKNLESKHKFLMYPRFIQVFLNKHKRLLLPHNRTYIAPTLTQKLFSNMRRASKGYARANIPLFPIMLIQGLVVQGEGSTVPVESHHTSTSAPSTSQPLISSPFRRNTRHEYVVPQPRSPTQTNVADEASSTGADVKHEGAATTITSLDAGQGSDRVVALETDLHQTKKVYGTSFTKLIKKVKKLEKTVKTQVRRKARIVVSDDEEDLEDPSKQGRKIAKIDQDPNISLVQHDAEVQGRHEHDMEPDFEFTTAEEVYTTEKEVSTTELVSTAGVSVCTAGASSAKDKARVEADEEFAQRLQSEEREMYSEAEKARLLAELINERKRYFAAQRAEERRNKPLTQAQQRTYMSQYIKNMGSHILKQLKSYSFDEIKNLFETIMRRVHTFIPMESESERVIPELAAGSSKRDAEEELVQESSKRQKTGESSEPAEEPKDKEKELSQERIHQMMIIVLEQGMTVKSLQTKLFEPDDDDELWKSQKHIFDVTWRLYDTCGVHHISTKDGMDIYMLVEREYPLSRGVLTQMLVAKLLVEQDNEMSKELLRKIFMQVERPRR